jgi:hypothetical protein
MINKNYLPICYFILFSNYNSNTNDLVNNECYSISGIIKAMADIDRETTPILYVSVKASDGVNSETVPRKNHRPAASH